MRRTSILFSVVLPFVPAVTWPQGMPLGPEFRVNTDTPGTQTNPSVAADASGNFVVVWQSHLGGPPPIAIDVFGQRYASSGNPLGPEFRVNTTSGGMFNAAVAAGASRDFVVVWEDGFYSVFGQRFAGSGAALGPEFHANTDTTHPKGDPSAAVDSSGNFVVVWDSLVQNGPIFHVFGQRFAAGGAPLGPEFRVNTHTTTIEDQPSVASDAAGNFVVVWTSHYQSGSYGDVLGQRYASSGSPLGPEFRVNASTIGAQGAPSVATDAAGGFVVVWRSYPKNGSNWDVYGRRFASSGAPFGPEFRVNSYTPNQQDWPAVAADSSGDFVVVWQSYTQDGSNDGVFGQRYASDGTPSGAEFRVNSYTSHSQLFPAVAADPSGGFIVIWESIGQLEPDYDVFGQRFGQIVPVELMRFGVE